MCDKARVISLIMIGIRIIFIIPTFHQHGSPYMCVPVISLDEKESFFKCFFQEFQEFFIILQRSYE